jgi:catechol 2,3-dioxygenase-like lactoylglutathione lyase family enzyme
VTLDQPRRPLFAVRRTNTILYCDHWAATVAFYQDDLGLPITHATDWFIEFQLTDQSYLSVADSVRATIRPAEGAGITLSWQVADIGSIHQQLLERGIQTTPLKQKWGAQVLYFYDPEGHRLELWEAL